MYHNHKRKGDVTGPLCQHSQLIVYQLYAPLIPYCDPDALFRAGVMFARRQQPTTKIKLGAKRSNTYQELAIMCTRRP